MQTRRPFGSRSRGVLTSLAPPPPCPIGPFVGPHTNTTCTSHLYLSACRLVTSDTIVPTLVFAFYELANHPEYQTRLLAALGNIDVYINHNKLRGCALLNAIVHETLRLRPPVPAGGYCQTPPAGITINGVIMHPRECNYNITPLFTWSTGIFF